MSLQITTFHISKKAMPLLYAYPEWALKKGALFHLRFLKKGTKKRQNIIGEMLFIFFPLNKIFFSN
jgi:hypothetical protein